MLGVPGQILIFVTVANALRCRYRDLLFFFLDYIKRVFEVMNNTPAHTYQILTKRSDRLKEFASELKWTANIWMGVSIEEESVTTRILDLIDIPAKAMFLSCKTLIG